MGNRCIAFLFAQCWLMVGQPVDITRWLLYLKSPAGSRQHTYMNGGWSLCRGVDLGHDQCQVYLEVYDSCMDLLLLYWPFYSTSTVVKVRTRVRDRRWSHFGTRPRLRAVERGRFTLLDHYSIMVIFVVSISDWWRSQRPGYTKQPCWIGEIGHVPEAEWKELRSSCC